MKQCGFQTYSKKFEKSFEKPTSRNKRVKTLNICTQQQCSWVTSICVLFRSVHTVCALCSAYMHSYPLADFCCRYCAVCGWLLWSDTLGLSWTIDYPFNYSTNTFTVIRFRCFAGGIIIIYKKLKKKVRILGIRFRINKKTFTDKENDIKYNYTTKVHWKMFLFF